jgi:hypothetical protein
MDSLLDSIIIIISNIQNCTTYIADFLDFLYSNCNFRSFNITDFSKFDDFGSTCEPKRITTNEFFEYDKKFTEKEKEELTYYSKWRDWFIVGYCIKYFIRRKYKLDILNTFEDFFTLTVEVPAKQNKNKKYTLKYRRLFANPYYTYSKRNFARSRFVYSMKRQYTTAILSKFMKAKLPQFEYRLPFIEKYKDQPMLDLYNFFKEHNYYTIYEQQIKKEKKVTGLTPEEQEEDNYIETLINNFRDIFNFREDEYNYYTSQDRYKDLTRTEVMDQVIMRMLEKFDKRNKNVLSNSEEFFEIQKWKAKRQNVVRLGDLEN